MIKLRSSRGSWATRLGGATVLALGLTASMGIGQASAGSATPAASCSPTVSRQAFGQAFDIYAGKKLQVFRYTLTNCNGMQVRILSYGGIIQSIEVPGPSGKKADVVLGFKTLQDYIANDSPPVTVNGGPYFGETVGRYGNRIAKGTFKLDGHTYTLPINNNGNTLHGGLVGLGNHVWASTAVHQSGAAGVQLNLVSPDGDDGTNVGCNSCTGFPGQLAVQVTFTLNNGGELHLQYRATTNKDTVLNLTNHSYFNLNGEASGVVDNQKVQINADAYTPTDATQIPTGQIANVAGTPFDFRAPHTIGSRINENNQQLLIAQGYDHNWVLNKTGPTLDGLRLAAHAWGTTGRELSVWTDQPGVQFYSGNFLTGTLVGISGHIYRQTDGYTFETQHFPDSPNQPSFPTTELKPGQVFSSSTIFQFSQ